MNASAFYYQEGLNNKEVAAEEQSRYSEDYSYQTFPNVKIFKITKNEAY